MNELLDGCSQVHRARLLAAGAPHSGAWLQAVPLHSLALHLDDETVRIAVGLRLGARVCEPHRCRCGSQVDTLGHHGLSCKYSAGRFPRHANLNDVVKRGLALLPGATRPGPRRWEKTRWPDCIPFQWRKESLLGCHLCGYLLPVFSHRLRTPPGCCCRCG